MTVTGISPYEPAVADWWHSERQRAAQVAVQQQGADAETLARVHAALTRSREPVYAAAMAEHYRSGPQPVIQPEAPADSGALRTLLTRLANAEAARLNPIFHASCPDCASSGGWCPRHRRMRDEHEFFTRLAARFATAVSDEDADFLLRKAADGNDIRVPADSGWKADRERAQDLLTEAEGNALPDSIGCCTDDSPCRDHAGAVEVSEFVGAIRDAVIDAGSAHEAAQLIAHVITGGK